MSKEVLVIFEWHHIGDCVMALPFIRSAQAVFDVYVYCRPQSLPILQFVLPSERIIAMTPPWSFRGKGLLAWIKNGHHFKRNLQALAPQHVVCVWADTRAHMCAVLSRAKNRVGFAMNSSNYYAWEAAFERSKLLQGKCLQRIAECLFGQRLLTRRLERTDYFQHHLDDWRQIAAAFSIELHTKAPWIPLEHVKARASEQVQTALAPSANQVCTVHPGARLNFKKWPLTHTLSLIEKLSSELRYTVRVICAPNETFPVSENHQYQIVRTETLHDLVYALAQTDILICLDSAAGHIAASLGKRVIALFGKMPCNWFAPVHNRHLVVGGALASERVTLSERSATMPDGFLVEHVSVQDVLDKVNGIQPKP